MKYLIGIDGGGTKTAFLLTDERGKPLNRLTLSRSNPADIGIEAAAKLLCDGITAVTPPDITPSALFAGISGVCSNDSYIGELTSALTRLLPNTVISVDSDGHNLLYAAFPESDGVAIICGTGSSCFVKTGKTVTRIGGYGPIDGCGNGYEIGKAALNHACRALDGRDSPSPLSEAVLAKHGEKLIERIGALISAGKSAIADYAPLVFKCFSTDPYARDIINANIGYLAELITSAGRFFPETYSVSLTGGIACDPLTQKLLSTRVPTRAELSVLNSEPVCGAAARARMLLNNR